MWLSLESGTAAASPQTAVKHREVIMRPFGSTVSACWCVSSCCTSWQLHFFHHLLIRPLVAACSIGNKLRFLVAIKSFFFSFVHICKSQFDRAAPDITETSLHRAAHSHFPAWMRWPVIGPTVATRGLIRSWFAAVLFLLFQVWDQSSEGTA